MANLLNICTLQLLCAFFTPCLIKITSAEVISVHPGENIILPCDITNYSKISWYQLRSDNVKELVSLEDWFQTFVITYIVDESHFIPEISSAVSLKIIGVRDTDLGFYFCGGWNKISHTPTQFGKIIRLNFTAISPAPKNDMEIDNFTKHQDTLLSTEFWIAVCVCPVSILINLICVFYCIFKGKSLSSCSYSSNAVASNKKEENIQYASVQYKRRSKATAKKNAALESVIYSTVVPKPQSH